MAALEDAVAPSGAPAEPAVVAATTSELLKQWNMEPDHAKRQELLAKLQEANVFPRELGPWERQAGTYEAIDDEETYAGLYPELEDPNFIAKLMVKQEFAENKQESILAQYKRGVNPCDPDQEFELTPVQRFVSRFLSPQCPYQSALLYHGVGVGKTCAAITIAENYLRAFPRRQVFIVAPRSIQPGFKRTIFDEDALVIPESPKEMNIARGCTGNYYLKKTGMEFEKDRGTVVRKVNELIRGRYVFLGYIQFQRYIDSVMARVPKTVANRDALVRIALQKEFNGRMLIIDEAHNLRDVPGETEEDDVDAPSGPDDMAESSAGRKLTPHLINTLRVVQGMKFVLLSGTPMYNSYREIIFLLNLLLINDKRATLTERDVFKPDGTYQAGGDRLLGLVASNYVSFMRGENPLSFPVRLSPLDGPKLEAWPATNPAGAEITEAELARDREGRARILRLPFVPVRFTGPAYATYTRLSEAAVAAGNLSINSIDEMVQAGNWIFPNDEGGGDIREAGFRAAFEERGGSTVATFKARNGAPTWLLEANLAAASPKAAYILGRIKTADVPGARGPVFIYSRYVTSGAIPLALALEANGYTAWGRDKPLLEDGIQDGLGRQCAHCERRERSHAGATHRFVPAKYALLTARANVTTSIPAIVRAARAESNKEGGEIKVIIGSQVASEGIDLRFIRQIFMFDSWFHLNKMEQVLGRGVRTCSHALLPDVGGRSQKNCTIHLLVNTFDAGETETADLYMYRNAYLKALQVGMVSRTLKQFALDCNLNRDAIIVSGFVDPVKHVDAAGKARDDVMLNDDDYSSLCDWLECRYDCALPGKSLEGIVPTLDTYDEYAARWRESKLKGMIRGLFEENQQPAFRLEELKELFMAAGIPPVVMATLLHEIQGNTSFRIRVGKQEGYIVYRNGYFLFQPDRLADIKIPLALRVADVPVRRDVYMPSAAAVAAAEPAVVPAAPDVAAPAGAALAEPGAAALGAAALGAAALGAAAAEPGSSPLEFWRAVCAWLDTIEGGTASFDIDPTVVELAKKRFAGEDLDNELERLNMVTWLYQDMRNNPAYPDAARPNFTGALAQAAAEMIWDTSLRWSEQMGIVDADKATPRTASCAREQVIQKGTTTAFRYVDIMTGAIKYMCNGVACSPAVARVLDSDAADPYKTVRCDRTVTGNIYGFLVPKAKARALVFKTSDNPPAPGGQPEKGGECIIVTTTSFHVRMLKQIAEILVGSGYPPFILVENTLDEKKAKVERERMEMEERAAAAREGRAVRSVTGAARTRIFRGAAKACALKELILRWLDIVSRGGGAGGGAAAGPGRRYFYRPISAIRAGHKGTYLKEASATATKSKKKKGLPADAEEDEA